MSPEQLQQAIGCSRLAAARFAAPISAALARWDIQTPARQAGFLAQTAHETEFFTQLEECLDYRPETIVAVWPGRFRFPHYSEINGGVRTVDAVEAAQSKFADGRLNALEYAHRPQLLANVVYADRMGNGGVASGDGWAYRGRGLAMLTGRGAYAQYAATLSDQAPGAVLGVTFAPELLLTDQWACDSAGWFWSTRGCQRYADTGDFSGLSYAWNGGSVGMTERIALSARALAFFNSQYPAAPPAPDDSLA